MHLECLKRVESRPQRITVTNELGNRKQVTVELGDIKNLMKNKFVPFRASRYTNVDMAGADGGYGAIVAEDHLSGFDEGNEGVEPVTVGAHGA